MRFIYPLRGRGVVSRVTSRIHVFETYHYIQSDPQQLTRAMHVRAGAVRGWLHASEAVYLPPLAKTSGRSLPALGRPALGPSLPERARA